MFSDITAGLVDWTSAQETCNQQGDMLAVPSDIMTFLNYTESQNILRLPYYIGGKRNSGSEWKWHGKIGPVFRNEYWTTGHSKDIDSTDSQCTSVLFGYKGLQKLFCSQSHGYICQQLNQQCDTIYIPLLASLILLLLLLIIGLSVYVFILKKKLQASVVTTEKSSILPVQSPMRYDSENSLYEQL
ncbi:unnamed protein product [Meganyctiphanes norvegica]|uniref:C-type lectin domain-containing protein n=1 Tax=Meganyctiphanes norvegica TaxID=48144 RepID=A0AAV2SS71_MEGNR